VFEYPFDSSKEARQVYQAGRHNLDNNRIRFTPIATIATVGLYALNKGRNSKKNAVDYLKLQYGRNSISTATRWVTMGETVGKSGEVLKELEKMGWLKPS
jgi:hypothetical protein